MKNYFLNYNQGINFFIFNNYHLILLFMTFAISLYLLFNYSFFKKMNNQTKKKIRIIYGFLLLVLFVIRRGSFLYFDVYNWKNHLDIGFCNFINLIFIIYCFTGDKKIYKICYYGAFMGPLVALMFPVINISINNYAFLVFVILHNVTFIMNLIFVMCEDIKYSKKDFVNTILIFFVYYCLTLVFNNIFNTNYNLLNNLLASNLKDILIVNVILNNRVLEMFFMIISMIFLMFIGRQLLIILKGCVKNEN